MSKVASITRAGGLIVNPQHATPSTTQYAQGYISEGAVVTDGLHLWLDAGDYSSFPGERSLATTWVDYGGHAADYDIVGDDGIILLGTYTSWAGRFGSTTTATGNHTVMFDYWSDNDSVAWSIDNDGVQNNDYNTTLTANKKKQTFSKTVNLTSTGTSTMYMRPHATGSKVYIANYRFFRNGTTWYDLSGNQRHHTISLDTGGELKADYGGYIYWGSGTTGSGATYADSSYSIFNSATSTATMSFWVRKKATSTNGSDLFTMDRDDANGVRIYLTPGSSSTAYFSTNGQSDQLVAGTTLSLNTWYHVVCTLASTAKNIYINGSLDGSQTVDATTISRSGSSEDNLGNLSGLGNGYQFKGDFGPVIFYTKALSAAEVKQNFNAERNRFGI